MPQKTSGVTGSKIKERIKACDKFILLATNGAIDSKWCNWELGYGDAHKYKKNIALFPMQEKTGTYNGSEYMNIYPYIVKLGYGYVYEINNKPVRPGYYVMTQEQEGPPSIISLAEWFKKDT